MSGRRPHGFAALLAALVVLLAGCSAAAPAATGAGAPAAFQDIDALLNAVAQQQRVDRTARFSLRGEITGGAAVQFTGTGVLRVLTDAVSAQFTQVVTQKGAAPQETSYLVLPDASYLRLPGEGNGEKPWVRVDPTATDAESKRLVGLSTMFTESVDPTRTLTRYGAATRIAGSAADVIDGDPAVRYTIVVDLAQAAAQQSDPAARAQLEQQVRAGLTTVTSTLWVDAVNRPVRSAVRQELPGIGQLAIAGSYRDWGQPVEITAPPAGQVR